MMDRDTRNAAIGALWVLLLFGIAAYYLPTVMLAVGRVSTILAAVIAAVFMVAIFVVFWLRGRSQRKKDH
jgi:ABC-type Na+ efflux pump permease subunit